MRWHFLAVAGFLAVLVFYLEENWRGAKAWSDTQAWIAAKGETLEWKTLIPPPVPDAQNLDAIDLFKLEPDPQTSGALEPLVLHRALKNILSDDYRLPVLGFWMAGKPVDVKSLGDNLSARYQKIFRPGPDTPPLDALTELDTLCPALNEIRAAAADRPRYRLNRDYTQTFPQQPSFGPDTKMINLAQAYNVHAILAIHAGRPDLALTDIETVLEIDSGLRQEPAVVSGLVAVGLMEIQVRSIWEGLSLHAWNDAQLVELQGKLKEIDFLSDEQLCLRGEATGMFIPMMDYLRTHRRAAGPMILGISSDTDHNLFPTRELMFLVPAGWFDLGKSLCASFIFRAADGDVDSTTRRVFPKKSEQLEQEVEKLDPRLPWNFLPRLALEPITKCTFAFAQGQFHVDAARIACRLERYRLAHGSYPDSLEDLRVFDRDEMPHDLMSGEPYHYQRQQDSYLLYSVGWNQTDDGGKPAYKPGSTTLDREHGDWVWPIFHADN